MKKGTLITVGVVAFLGILLYVRNKKNASAKVLVPEIDIKKVPSDTTDRPERITSPSILKDLREPIIKSNVSVEPFARDFDAHTMATVAQPKTLISPANYKFNKTILVTDI